MQLLLDVIMRRKNGRETYDEIREKKKKDQYSQAMLARSFENVS